MQDHLFRPADRDHRHFFRKARHAAAFANPTVLAAILGLAFSAFVVTDYVHAAGGQQAGQPQIQSPTAATNASQQPAGADEGTFGSTPGAPVTTPTVAPWMTVPPTEYDKHVAAKYNYAFGKDTPF